MYSICWKLLWSLGVVNNMICYSTWNLLRTLLLVKQQLSSLPIWSQYVQQDLFLFFLFCFVFLIPSKQFAFNTILSFTGFVPACGNHDELWCRMFEPLSNVQPAALGIDAYCIYVSVCRQSQAYQDILRSYNSYLNICL